MLEVAAFVSCPSLSVTVIPGLGPFSLVCAVPLSRFKPLQKVDGMGDNLAGGAQNSAATPEQSVAAQSQHHQQFIGKGW